MSQDCARTRKGYSRRLFLKYLRTVVERLEFADELGLQQHRQHLGGNLVTLERLLLDLFADCTPAGRDGARFYSAAERLCGDLKVCVRAHDQGDLGPWRRARGQIVERLHALGLMLEPQRDVEISRSPAPAVEIRQEARESRDCTSSRFSNRAFRVLRLLSEHSATSEGDRVTRSYIREETELSEAQVRRAIENELNPRGLLGSKPGREGGVWLSAQGIQAVRQMGEKK